MKGSKKYPPSVAFKDFLIEDLKDPKVAIGYLNAVLDEEDEEAFLVALHDVAQAHGGIAPVAKLSGIHRVTLHRIMSKKGNPRLDSLAGILHVFGLKLAVVPEKVFVLKKAA